MIDFEHLLIAKILLYLAHDAAGPVASIQEKTKCETV